MKSYNTDLLIIQFLDKDRKEIIQLKLVSSQESIFESTTLKRRSWLVFLLFLLGASYGRVILKKRCVHVLKEW